MPLLFDPNLRPGALGGPRRGAAALPRARGRGDAAQVQPRRGAMAARPTTASTPSGAPRRSPSSARRSSWSPPAPGRWSARGACEARVEPPAVDMVSPLGAGDCFMGTLAAELLAGEWRLADGEAALRPRGRGRRRGLHAARRVRLMSGGGERGYARGRGAERGRRDLDARPRFPVPKGWRRPSKARVRAIRDRPARALRIAAQRPARGPGPRAGPDDPLPEHERRQPRRRLPAPARPLRRLGRRSATRRPPR